MPMQSIALAPLVAALTELVKRLGLPSKYAPLVSIGLGIGLQFAVAAGVTTIDTALQGLVIGLAASGLYSGGKTLVKKK